MKLGKRLDLHSTVSQAGSQQTKAEEQGKNPEQIEKVKEKREESERENN